MKNNYNKFKATPILIIRNSKNKLWKRNILKFQIKIIIIIREKIKEEKQILRKKRENPKKRNQNKGV